MQVARSTAESLPSGSTISVLLRRSLHSLFPSFTTALGETSLGFETNGRSRSDVDGGRQELRTEPGLIEGDDLLSGSGGRRRDWHLGGHGDQSIKNEMRFSKRVFGSDVLGHSTCVPQSSSSSPKRHPSRQSFARDFSSAASSPASKNYGPSNTEEYNKLILTMNYRRRPQVVRDVYEDMLLDGVQPNQETFSLLIDGCMKGSQLQDVTYFFEEMKAMGLAPDTALYNCIIAACGKSMQVDRAFQVAAEMEASGIQPKHRTYLALMRTCAIAGRLDEAYGVVRRMAASGLTLDKRFYCALIFAHKNKKPNTVDDVQKILGLLEQSKQQSAEDKMAVAATGELQTSDDNDDDGLANLLWDDFPRRGFIDRRLAVYHAAANALSALGNKEAVKSILNLIEKDGQELDSYCLTYLVKCHLADGDFEQACAEFTKHVDAGRLPTLELYLVLIGGALEHLTPDTSALARKLLADLSHQGYFLNSYMGSKLMQKCCLGKARDIAIANAVWDTMRNREVRVSKFVLTEYFRALERSNTPKDDPRFIEVKALVDEGKRFMIKAKLGPGQTAQADHVLAEASLSEQGDGQTTPLGMPMDPSYSETDGPDVAEESPIEAPTNIETPHLPLENVASNEQQ